MRVCIIFLDYLRKDHSVKALQSIVDAGHPFDLITIDRKGISAAINDGLDLTGDYDAIVTCANDIVMPSGWLKAMVDNVIPEAGMIGIHCVESQGEPAIMYGRQIMRTEKPYGNVMITREAIDRCGYFNEGYDPYGMQDSDYGHRLTMLGFINYYLPGLSSHHVGHDVGSGTDYRRMKDEGLSLCDQKWSYYTGRYIERGDYTIFMRDTI